MQKQKIFGAGQIQQLGDDAWSGLEIVDFKIQMICQYGSLKSMRRHFIMLHRILTMMKLRFLLFLYIHLSCTC